MLSPGEKHLAINQISDHWKLFFRFAFCTGLRQSEQLVLRTSDVDLDKGNLAVKHALSLDVDEKVTIEDTKNLYSRRTIPLLPVITEVLQTQLNVNQR